MSRLSAADLKRVGLPFREGSTGGLIVETSQLTEVSKSELPKGVQDFVAQKGASYRRVGIPFGARVYEVPRPAGEDHFTDAKGTERLYYMEAYTEGGAYVHDVLTERGETKIDSAVSSFSSPLPVHWDGRLYPKP